MYLNNSCIRKCDVLFRKECFHRLRDNEGQEESVFTRLILDLDAEKFVHLHRAERTTIDRKGNKKKDARYIAAKYNHGKLEMRIPIMHFRPVVRSFPEACKSAELVDVRFVGITGFPILFGAEGLDFQKRLAAVNVSTNSKVPFRLDKRTASSTRIFQRAELPNNPGMSFQMTWNLDVEKIMPFEYVSSTSGLLDGQQITTLSTSASFTWTKQSECFVPRTIDQVVNSSHRTTNDDGKEVSYAYPRDEIFDFHWFSVNEIIPDKLIDDVAVASFDKWMPLTDPKLSHATELE